MSCGICFPRRESRYFSNRAQWTREVLRLRVRDTARLCGNVFSENQLITRFILGSHADIKPVILSNKSLWGRVSFDEFVRRAQALGDSHRALIGEEDPNRSCHGCLASRGASLLTILSS